MGLAARPRLLPPWLENIREVPDFVPETSDNRLMGDETRDRADGPKGGAPLAPRLELPPAKLGREC